MSTLAESYAWCRRTARARARNFYYSFLLLPPPKKDAICAVYAFMRHCDDLSDDPGPRDPREALEGCRLELDAALAGRYGSAPFWPALDDAVRRYRIPHEYFQQMIEGVTSDLTARRIRTFEDLYRYCYQVASVVGLTVIHVFGFEDPRAPALAEKCGVAFQLTNILRDVREDAARGRVYLPAEDLERFHVQPSVFEGEARPEEFLQLMRFEAARARRFYREAAPLVGLVDSPARASLRALIEIYWRLLLRIEDSGFDVLRRRIALPAREKAWILARTALGWNGTFETARPD